MTCRGWGGGWPGRPAGRGRRRGAGRAMLAGLVAGGAEPAVLADLAKGQVRNKQPELERALTGQFGDHQRYVVPRLLAAIDCLDSEIADLDTRVAELERPVAEAVG